MYSCLLFFFFNDTATTEIYTLSLHDALPISASSCSVPISRSTGATSRTTNGSETNIVASTMPGVEKITWMPLSASQPDRKSTRLNSSHANISYAVFCLKKTNLNNSHTNSSYD